MAIYVNPSLDPDAVREIFANRPPRPASLQSYTERGKAVEDLLRGAQRDFATGAPVWDNLRVRVMRLVEQALRDGGDTFAPVDEDVEDDFPF
jgi:hypothetical protein